MEEEEVSFDGDITLNQLELGVRIFACHCLLLLRSPCASRRRKEAESNSLTVARAATQPFSNISWASSGDHAPSFPDKSYWPIRLTLVLRFVPALDSSHTFKDPASYAQRCFHL